MRPDSMARWHRTARTFHVTPQPWTSATPVDRSTEQPAGVPCDHQFLVRRNCPRRDSGPRDSDPRAACGVCGRVEFDAEPSGIAADPFPNVGRVLTNAAGEYDRVQPAKGGRQRAELSPNAIAKKFDCELGPRIVRCQERTHIAGESGHS